MTSLKKVYDEMDALLEKNTQISIQMQESIKKIKGKIANRKKENSIYQHVVIPILTTVCSPKIINSYAPGEQFQVQGYELERIKKVSTEIKVDKEELQVLLDKYSPIKLVVKDFEYVKGFGGSGHYQATISIE